MPLLAFAGDFMEVATGICLRPTPLAGMRVVGEASQYVAVEQEIGICQSKSVFQPAPAR